MTSKIDTWYDVSIFEPSGINTVNQVLIADNKKVNT